MQKIVFLAPLSKHTIGSGYPAIGSYLRYLGR